MKNKGLQLILFILSLICLIISAKLFYQLGIYVDEANTSPSVVLGGNFGALNNKITFLLLKFVGYLQLT